MAGSRSPTPNPGVGVDASGFPVQDPTANVLDLVEAAIKRQDDLREAEARHVREMISIRAAYEEKLAAVETARLDAIRAVDVGAVNRAAEVAATQATTLAAQVATSAEAMRAQVAAAASASVTGLAAALEPIQKDIQDLRKAQYEQQGRGTQVSESRASGANLGLWIGLAVAVAGIGGTFLLGVAGVVVTLILSG